MRREKEDLREVTLHQRTDLHDLDREVAHLRAQLAEVDLLCADSYARHCAVDTIRLELERLRAERVRLEEELSAWHGSAARVRSARDACAKHDADRCEWRAERVALERELTSVRSQLTNFEEDAEQRQARYVADAALHRSASKALQEELSMQRRLRNEAERAILAAQQEIASVREQQRRDGSQAARIEVERGKLTEARSRLGQESDARRRQADMLQASVAELETLRKELQELAQGGDQLRAGLHRTLHGLEEIRRQSHGAEEAMRSLREGVKDVRKAHTARPERWR